MPYAQLPCVHSTSYIDLINVLAQVFCLTAGIGISLSTDCVFNLLTVDVPVLIKDMYSMSIGIGAN